MTARVRDGAATAGLPAAERVTVGTAAGWGPMLLTVQAAAADPAAAQVVVDAVVVMVTDQPDNRIFEQVALSWGPNWLWLDRGRSRLPVIAPHGSAAARLVFPLDPAGLLRSADGMPGLAEASLVLAGGWTDHTVVPFGAGPAALNRPTPFAVGGTLTSPTATLTVLDGRVSMGRLADWIPPDDERAWLHLTYDVIAAEDAPFPGVFPERRLMLRLPDGSSVRAGDGSPFDLLVDPGDTVTGAVVGFPVVMPVAGDYQLQLGTDTLDFHVAATGFGAPPWAPRPLVPRTPACVPLAPPSGTPGTVLGRAFAVGAISARLCEVAHDGETLWATLALTNPFRHRLEVAGRLGALVAVARGLARPVRAQVSGSDLPSGGSGMVRLRFDCVTALDGVRLAIDAGQARDLVALDPNASDETDTLGIPVAVSGDLHVAGTLVRVRDAAVLAGTFDDALDLAPDGHRHLGVRFDFFARGAVPVSSSDDGSSEDGEEFLTLYGFAAPGPFTLTTPDGSESVPVRVTPVNPTAYPREQLRGVVAHFEVPAPVAGSYRLTYAFQDKSASLDIDIPRERGR